MFRGDHPKTKEHINFLFNSGGMGDHICNMPAIWYAYTQYPHIVPHLWVPDFFLDLAKNLLPGVIIKPFSRQKEYNDKMPGKQIYSQQHTSMSTHLVDTAFHMLLDKSVDIEHKNYRLLNLDKISIKKFTLPEKYVVVTTGFTAEVREMLPNVVNSVSAYIKEKGYTPVFLGSHVAKVGTTMVNDIKGTFKADVNYNAGIDLIDKTTLLEAGKIISGAKCIVGLDSGLLHLAGCTDTPIVASFTSVKPEHRLPYRKNQLGWNCYPIEPPATLACRGCQSNWEFIFTHDYRKCFYVENKLDTEIQCVKSLTSDLYIEQLEKIL